MSVLHILLFLLLCAVALGWLARKFAIPYPIALVLGGGALGFIPGLPQLNFDPQFLLVLVLPPVLYQAALLTSWRDFKANSGSIGLLAFGLVIATTLAVGATAKWLMPEMPWAAAFALGAIVSPPDAVAATSILSRLNIPRRVVVVLEGESLVNDASGLVLYKFAVAAALTGVFSLWDASWQFVWVALGGCVIGWLLAHLFVRLHKVLGDPFIEVVLSLSVPYTAYIFAESLHVSGVLAVVVAGLVRARYSPEIVSAQMRILARSVWNIQVFLLNSLVFILIGLQLSEIVERPHVSAWTLVLYGGVISLVAIVVRFLWVYPTAYLPGWLSPSEHQKNTAPEGGQTFIISWCGMRGIVSLAAALALPVAVAGQNAFPYRDEIIVITFVVIAITLVVQGLSLPRLIHKLNLDSDDTGHQEEARARASMLAAAMKVLETDERRATVAPAYMARLQAEMSDTGPVHGDDVATTEAGRVLKGAALAAQRAALIAEWRANHISDEVLHHLEEELDYREARL
ncbi:MAG: Na+/H+ antiporter [Burkholderiales bacterium]|nr:Na+/H+ antiporter [Burkholderiales bacterium]